MLWAVIVALWAVVAFCSSLLAIRLQAMAQGAFWDNGAAVCSLSSEQEDFGGKSAGNMDANTHANPDL